jgi:hypothetical protein
MTKFDASHETEREALRTVYDDNSWELAELLNAMLPGGLQLLAMNAGILQQEAMKEYARREA